MNTFNLKNLTYIQSVYVTIVLGFFFQTTHTHILGQIGFNYLQNNSEGETEHKMGTRLPWEKNEKWPRGAKYGATKCLNKEVEIVKR